MGRRAGLGPAAAGVLVVCLLLFAGTAAGDPGADKARIDGRIDTLRGRAVASDRQVGVLTEQLSAVAGQVRELEEGVRAQQARLSVLEGQLSAARGRLAALDKTIARQTERLERLRGEYRVALSRLERRVRELYMTDGPDALAFVLGTASFADLIDNIDLLNRIGRQDEEIAAWVKALLFWPGMYLDMLTGSLCVTLFRGGSSHAGASAFVKVIAITLAQGAIVSLEVFLVASALLLIRVIFR